MALYVEGKRLLRWIVKSTNIQLAIGCGTAESSVKMFKLTLSLVIYNFRYRETRWRNGTKSTTLPAPQDTLELEFFNIQLDWCFSGEKFTLWSPVSPVPNEGVGGEKCKWILHTFHMWGVDSSPIGFK